LLRRRMMTGPALWSRLALVVEVLRRPILLWAPLDSRRMRLEGLLLRVKASDMAEWMEGEETAKVGLMISGRVMGAGSSEGVALWPRMASGLADMDVFVGGMEATDTRLPREELLDMADGALETGSIEAIPSCLGSSLRDTGWRLSLWAGKPNSPSGSGDEGDERAASMVMGKERKAD
jgi:hypothetical protein